MRGIHRLVLVAAVATALGATAVTPAGAATTSSATTPTYSQWLADTTADTAPALAYLQQRVADGSFTGTPALVLDIDNTALASYYNPGKYPTPATPPVLQLAQYASAHGVKIFFVTARPELIDLVTQFNLNQVGYSVDGLYSRDPLELLEPIQTFKTETRKELVSEGYDIVANVGNNVTDLEGGYADATFKLPDYNGLLS